VRRERSAHISILIFPQSEIGDLQRKFLFGGICILKPPANRPVPNRSECFPSLVNKEEQNRRNHRSIPSGVKEGGREQYPRHIRAIRKVARKEIEGGIKRFRKRFQSESEKSEGNRASYSIERKTRSSLPLPDSTHR